MRLSKVRYQAIMPAKTAALLVIVVLGFAGGMAVYARSAHQAPAEDPSLSDEQRTRLLAKGQEIFVERCARCHNPRGDKPLKTGAPLNERGLSADTIARAVSGRLKDRTEDERRAVTIYISSLMKTKDSEAKAAPKP
jgi:mono/diheme cytochrome c family protein